jgi:hypothetical protein
VPDLVQAKLPLPRLAVPLGHLTIVPRGPGCCPGPATAGGSRSRQLGLVSLWQGQQASIGESELWCRGSSPHEQQDAAGASGFGVQLRLPAASRAGKLPTAMRSTARCHIAWLLRATGRRAEAGMVRWRRTPRLQATIHAVSPLSIQLSGHTAFNCMPQRCHILFATAVTCRHESYGIPTARCQ